LQLHAMHRIFVTHHRTIISHRSHDLLLACYLVDWIIHRLLVFPLTARHSNAFI